MHSRGLVLKAVVAVYGMSAFFSLAFAQSHGFLADRHAAMGVSCQDCHDSPSPTTSLHFLPWFIMKT